MYKRKTSDEWQLWLDYGQGFEHTESTETSREIRAIARDYQENLPQYPRKTKFARVPITGS